MLVAENILNKINADTGITLSVIHGKESVADSWVSAWYLTRTRTICQFLSKMQMH